MTTVPISHQIIIKSFIDIYTTKLFTDSKFVITYKRNRQIFLSINIDNTIAVLFIGGGTTIKYNTTLQKIDNTISSIFDHIRHSQYTFYDQL